MFFEISDLIAAVSIIVTMGTFLAQHIRTIRVETIHQLNDLFDYYYTELQGKTVNTNYLDFVKYMSRLDRFAVAVNEGIYCKGMVKKRASILLTKQYDEFMKGIITQRRAQFHRENYYENIEKLIKSFGNKY